MTEALNRLDSYVQLGTQELAYAPVVRLELARAGLDDTAFQRGRALSRLIRREVMKEFERYQAHPTGRDVAEWTILYLRVHEGRSLQEIAQRLNMPPRSVARYYARSKALLADRLYATAETLPALGLYCPRCGARVLERVPDERTSLTCASCGASLDISPQRDGGSFRVQMQTPDSAE
jgi:Sigma-70, region 4